MNLAVLTLLLLTTVVSADIFRDYSTLSNAISSPRQRRSLEDHELVKKFLDVLEHVEEYGSEKAKEAKAELMQLLEKVEEFKFGDWLDSARAKLGKRGMVADAKAALKEMKDGAKKAAKNVVNSAGALAALGALKMLQLTVEAVSWLEKQRQHLEHLEKLDRLNDKDKREIAAFADDVETNKKMMDKILLLAKLKFNQFKTKLGAAFDKLQNEFEPIGQKYKKYGETISMVAVNGLKKFAKANVDIFNSFQEKVKANVNGLMADGKAFLHLVKDKTIKSFGRK